MLFSSCYRSFAASLAVALLAGCEGPPEPEPDDPCGATFPSAPDGAGEIVYVAAQCLEAEADGTEAHPFVRIGDALAHAGDGATILVSSGMYTEKLTITRPVTIVGSSSPASPDGAAISLQAEQDTAIHVIDTDAVLIGVRVEAARSVGVLLDGGTLRLEGSVVEGTLPGSDGLPGVGVLARMNGSLTLQSTWVTATSGMGVLVTGAAATIAESEVRDSEGNGIVLDRALGEVLIIDTTVSGSVGTGIRVASSRALVEQTTVSGTLGDENDAGEGILSYEAQSPEGDSFGPADLIVRGSVVSGNGRTGILGSSGTRTILLQDNTISDNGLPGTSVFEYVAGIWLQSDVASDPVSEISGNTISGNKLAGIFMIGETYGIPVVENTVSGTLIDDLYESHAGDGISLVGGASAMLKDNIVTASGRFGIMVDAAPEEATEISNNTIQNNAEYGIVLQDQVWIATDTNTFGGNASGDVAEVPADTYANPDRPLDP